MRVVGPGTPAAEAGLQVDDVITELNGQPVLGPIEFQDALEKTEPGDEFTLTINRDMPAGAVAGRKLTGTLRRRPMEVIRPEGIDSLSFLLTLDSIDGERIAKDADELPGVMMRTANWQVLPRVDPDEIAFQYDLADAGLSVIKKFRLAKVDPAEANDPAAKAYHLEFAIEVRNTGDAAHKVAWRLEGPTGLPLEGAWYAMKISPNMRGGAGMRDVVVGFLANRSEKNGLVSAYTIAEGTDLPSWQDDWLKYIGVDAQYFAVALLPASADEAADANAANETNYGRAVPIRVGDVPADRSKLNRTNVSFRLVSKVETVAPQGKAFTQSFKIFSGPKKPALLAHYGLGKLVYYGWFGWVAAADARGAALLLSHHSQLRHRHHHAHRAGAFGDVPAQSAASPERAEDAGAAARDQADRRRSTKATWRPAARRSRSCSASTSTTRWPAACRSSCSCRSSSGLYRSLSVDVELRSAADQRIDPLVLEPGGARHAVVLA